MILEEAQVILAELAEMGFRVPYDDQIIAIRLGVEALKREQERRHSIYWSGAALLPGETED